MYPFDNIFFSSSTILKLSNFQKEKMNQQRFQDASVFCNTAKNKFISALANASKDQMLRCIRKFFEVAEDSSYEDRMPLASRELLENNPEKLKSLCTELCMEAINRDFVSYISTGFKGPVGQSVYNALRKNNEDVF